MAESIRGGPYAAVELQPSHGAGSTTDGGGAGVRIAAAFTPESERDAYMHIHLYPPGTSLSEVRWTIGGFMTGREPADNPADADTEPDSWRAIAAPGWAIEAYSYHYDTLDHAYVGRITIGRHGDLYFHVLTHYPPEYGDGLGPRFNALLDARRWEDTGRMLRGN